MSIKTVFGLDSQHKHVNHSLYIKDSKNALTFQKVDFIYFNKNPIKNYEKCFLFHLKSSFRS